MTTIFPTLVIQPQLCIFDSALILNSIIYPI